jgi:hypothetical protein
LVIAEEKRQLLHRVELTQQDVPARQSPVEQVKPANDTKKILLDESDSSKFVIIGTGLSAKEESELTSFLRENQTSLRGLQKTCQVCRGSWLNTHSTSGRMPSWSSNRCGDLQKRKERPLVRRSPGSLQPASSWKYFTLTGW